MKVYIIVMVLYTFAFAFVRWSVIPSMRPYFGPRLFASVALTTLALTYSPTAPIYVFSCLLIFVATVRKRLDAICSFIMMGVLAPTLGATLVAGGTYLLQVQTVHLLAIGLAIALAIHAKREKLRPLKGVTVEDALVVILYLALWIGAARFPSFTITGRAGLEQALWTPLPYLLFRNNLRSVDEVRVAGMCLAAAGAITSVLALYESRSGWLPITHLGQHINTMSYGLSILFRGNLLRPATSTGNPLVLASILVMSFAAAASSRKFFRTREAYFAWMGLLALVLVLAQSRGNLVVLGLTCVLLLALSGRKVLAGLIGLVAFGTYEALWVLARQSPQIAAFLGVADQSQRFGGHFDYRGYLLQRGLEEGAKHRWFGTSMDNVVMHLTDLTQGQHIIDFVNTYLVIYLVSGAVGIASVVVLMSLIFLKLFRSRVRRLPDFRAARALILTSLFGLAVALSFMSYIGCIPLLLTFVLAASRTLRLDGARTLRQRKTAPEVTPDVPPLPLAA